MTHGHGRPVLNARRTVNGQLGIDVEDPYGDAGPEGALLPEGPWSRLEGACRSLAGKALPVEVPCGDWPSFTFGDLLARHGTVAHGSEVQYSPAGLPTDLPYWLCYEAARLVARRVNGRLVVGLALHASDTAYEGASWVLHSWVQRPDGQLLDGLSVAHWYIGLPVATGKGGQKVRSWWRNSLDFKNGSIPGFIFKDGALDARRKGEQIWQ